MENCSNIYIFWFYGKFVVNEAVLRINSSWPKILSFHQVALRPTKV